MGQYELEIEGLTPETIDELIDAGMTVAEYLGEEW